MQAIVGILFPTTFILMLVLERIFPARKLPKIRFWFVKGLVFFVMAAIVGGLVPALIAAPVQAHSPLKLGFLGTALGGVIAFLVTDIVSYGVHRTLHNVPFLWRWTHQLHHSAERVDILGASYIHPLDVFVQAASTSVAVALLGVSPDAAALAGYLGFFVAMFQHLNVKTPAWVGWIIQRPEAHSIHHARGVHAYNYGNFMLWDILFGTFRNPATFIDQPLGFWDGASGKIGSMFIGRDVTEPSSRVGA
jgi:sterol desaturase/sphingolipid hydroxylase (fatty acid hydroxylase superfamily)